MLLLKWRRTSRHASTVAAAITAANIASGATIVPQLTVNVEHHPRLDLYLDDQRCVVLVSGKSFAGCVFHM